MEKKLTINNLMAGDWVYVDGYEEPCRIETLGKCDVNTSELDEIEYKDLRPIPITVEILENNGFKHTSEKIYSYDINECEDDIWLLPEKDGSWTLKIHVLPELFRKKVSMVHELQQAIRLFNIDKDIDLEFDLENSQEYVDSKGNMVKAIQWNGDNIVEMQEFSDRIMFLVVNPRPEGATDEEWASTGEYKVILEDEGMDIKIEEGDYVVKLTENFISVFTKSDFEKTFIKK